MGGSGEIARIIDTFLTFVGSWVIICALVGVILIVIPTLFTRQREPWIKPTRPDDASMKSSSGKNKQPGDTDATD